MSDNNYYRPAIPLLISLIGGILIGSGLAGYESWAAAAAVVCAGFCWRQIFQKKNAGILPVVLFVSLGYLSIQPWLSPRLPSNHILHYSDTHRWDISGRIIDTPRKINNRTRFLLQVTSLGFDAQIHVVSGTLRVTAVGDVPDFSLGDKIGFNSRIRSLANFKNPGGFDYKRYMAFKGIQATAYIKGDRLIVINEHPAGGFFQIMEKARSRFAGLIEESAQARVQGVLKALIIGDRSQISDETRQIFNRAGVGHLLAISGLHVGIVATVAFGFFRCLLARFKPFLWRAWTRKGAALVSLLPVFCYGIIAGFSPSTQRAVIMVSVFLLTFLFERDQDPLNTLSLAALVILIADPPSLFSISFQLSFAAAGGDNKITTKRPGAVPFRRQAGFFFPSLLFCCLRQFAPRRCLLQSDFPNRACRQFYCDSFGWIHYDSPGPAGSFCVAAKHDLGRLVHSGRQWDLDGRFGGGTIFC